MGERGARQITVVEMLEDVALDMLPWSKEFLMERLSGYGVNILTSTKVKEVLDDGGVFTRNGKAGDGGKISKRSIGEDKRQSG
jgi:NADPH-dependent 2,4-dienoyl-CoA reductase/sulfur reductase-like enzyme